MDGEGEGEGEGEGGGGRGEGGGGRGEGGRGVGYRKNSHDQGTWRKNNDLPFKSLYKGL